MKINEPTLEYVGKKNLTKASLEPIYMDNSKYKDVLDNGKFNKFF